MGAGNHDLVVCKRFRHFSDKIHKDRMGKRKTRENSIVNCNSEQNKGTKQSLKESNTPIQCQGTFYVDRCIRKHDARLSSVPVRAAQDEQLVSRIVVLSAGIR